MKLLDVRAVLERETDIQQTDPEREVLKELDDKGTHYAILSHRWGAEAGYKEMVGLMKMEERKRDEVRRRDGYQKIIKSCEQATNDGYEWLWIDTCCIDKRSSSELSEAINSMYRWYRNAQVCYAYLNDVDGSVFPVRRDVIKFGKSFGWPEWFVRGWTLQELIAPKQVEFFNKDWVSIGNKRRLAPVLQEITGIPTEVLRVGLDVKRLCVAEIMSWAAKRETTCVEDRAYSLMGLFRVNMPMLYGEGEKAFQRLQLEIIRTSNDHSIFAWNPWRPRTGSVLADDPSDFWRCGGIAKLESNEFADRLMKYIEENELGNPWYIQRNSTKIATNPIHWCRLAWLRWRLRSLSQPLRTFAISNGGIQVCLPVIPLSNSPFHCRAVLACGYGEVGLVSIDLVSSGSSFDRASDALHLPYIKAYPEFKTLYLTHHQDANEMHRGFALDDKHASYHGFTRRGTYPREFRGDSVTLSSLKDDLIVIVYANDDASSRFAVGLGYYLSQGWVHVFYDEDSPTQGTDWRDFGRRAYYRMGGARADHARNMPKQEHEDERSNDHFIKHAHLPRSIWAARVVWGRREMGNFKLMVDVEQCPGCCDGPRGWTTTSNDWSGLDMPGPMNPVRHTYRLHLDGCQVRLDKCSGQQIALGDYGDYSNGTLICTGNIYEDMRTLGINTMDLADCSTASSKSDYAVPMMENEYDLTVAYHDEGMHLALRRSKGLSLPVNECFVLLLKALSTRAAGKHLVIAVIKCSDFCTFDDDGEQRDSGGEPASDSGSHSREPRVLTPLYAVASPQVWRKEPPCRQRREQFQSIRKHFYALVNMHEITGPRARHKSVHRQKKDRAINSFSDMFGLKYLRNYVGEITFFERFPWAIETDSLSEVSVGTAEEDELLASAPRLSCTDWAMTCNLFVGSRQLDAARDPRLEVVLPQLCRRCQTLSAWDITSRRYDEMQKVQNESKSIAHSLGAGLLNYIWTTFDFASVGIEHSSIDMGRCIEYDRQLDFHSMVREIEVLQAKLNAIEDEDEQRALEEDVTGKILWLCWCGICAEVDQLLPQVADYIRSERKFVGLRAILNSLMTGPLANPSDDQVHLQRILFDAGAGTSKHQLLLAARAAEQAKWSGTIVPWDTNTNMQGPSTSFQTPPTPAV